jgi:archaellum biogenesis ATPase FlaH
MRVREDPFKDLKRFDEPPDHKVVPLRDEPFPPMDAYADEVEHHFTGRAKAPQRATPQTIQDFQIDDSEAFLSDLQPLEYLIDGLLPTGVAYSLTGYAGHGKTTLALQFAICVARGEMFGDRETSKGRVLILAGENPYNVKWQYAAALAARNLSPADVDIHFVQGRFSIAEWTDVLRAKMEAMPDLKLVIVDSLQAFFEGDNDNDNSQMVEMAHKLRDLCNVSQRPAILIIAHPAGKVAAKDNLVPRGGGAFLNEIDGNLTVWSQDASQQTLHHSQKFRGAGFDPMEWVMQVHEFSHLADIHGTPLKLPVSRPESAIERGNREVQSDDLLRRYLETVADEKPVSVREGMSRFDVKRWRMQSTIETAQSEKLIKRYAKTWVLTDGGKAYLEAQNAGY